MRQEKSKKEVVEEYLRGGISLRELGRRHGIRHQTLYRWVKAYQSGQQNESRRPEAIREMPKEVGRLQRELYEARLEAKLYRTMVEVAEKEFGIKIRKKSGAR
jgi:transposase-like protein